MLADRVVGKSGVGTSTKLDAEGVLLRMNERVTGDEDSNKETEETGGERCKKTR